MKDGFAYKVCSDKTTINIQCPIKGTFAYSAIGSGVGIQRLYANIVPKTTGNNLKDKVARTEF